MAHFAELDDNNKVLRIIVVSNLEMLDADGQESEAIGITFCQSHFGGRWVQTSYNGNFRKRYAQIDATYDAERDIFIDPSPYPSWTFDTVTNEWTPPIPRPADDGRNYVWSEPLGAWRDFADIVQG